MGGTSALNPQYYFRCLNHIHPSNKVMLLDFTFTHTRTHARTRRPDSLNRMYNLKSKLQPHRSHFLHGVFTIWGGGGGETSQFFSCIILYREQNMDSVQEASIQRLLCYCVPTTSRWHIVSVCFWTTIAVTWYSTSIVPFLIAVWKKHSDLPAGRRNVNSLSRFDPKQLTEPNNQPNIKAKRHRAPLLRRDSIPIENVRGLSGFSHLREPLPHHNFARFWLAERWRATAVL